MIVDDHAVFRHLIRQATTTPDDTVLECVSADDALKSIGAFKPDCVTMDVRMPGMCAFKAIRQIREYHPKVRVLVVSSYDESDLRRAARRAGSHRLCLQRKTWRNCFCSPRRTGCSAMTKPVKITDPAK